MPRPYLYTHCTSHCGLLVYTHCLSVRGNEVTELKVSHHQQQPSFSCWRPGYFHGRVNFSFFRSHRLTGWQSSSRLSTYEHISPSSDCLPFSSSSSAWFEIQQETEGRSFSVVAAVVNARHAADVRSHLGTSHKNSSSVAACGNGILNLSRVTVQWHTRSMQVASELDPSGK